jgi:hypothetical protein|tara:strand:- start:74 stop:193 length:120 start_codon:yes stop_codon:yes gene_type:complete
MGFPSGCGASPLALLRVIDKLKRERGRAQPQMKENLKWL